jgi:uncharacterized protein (TIGR04222 family)
MIITPLVDFFPFNMESGPAFLVFYAALAFVGLNFVGVVRTFVGGWLDGRAATGGPNPALVVGRVPPADDCLAVAYLREGTNGIANTLVSEAVAEGWLRPPPSPKQPSKPSQEPFSVRDRPPSLRAAVPLHQALTRAGTAAHTASAVRRFAKEAARAIERDLAPRLTAAGLVRAPATVWSLRVLVALGGGLILLVGLVRILRAVELNRPFTLLAWEMVAVAIAILGMGFSSATRESRLRGRYLDWLDGATTSLQADVTSGRRREARDVALAVAVGGVAILAPPLYESLSSAFASTPRPTASTGRGSSSSCSSSSCGGGGGCGGDG